MASVSGALRLGIAGDTNSIGADTVYGFAGTDALTAEEGRGPAGSDHFLDDAGGSFDAALGYALAFQHLLAEAWKGAPSVILRHLDQDGSCALAPLQEAVDGAAQQPASASDGGSIADPPIVDIVAQGPLSDGGDADFADGGIAGGDLFGMS